jgi:hypothetical protein
MRTRFWNAAAVVATLVWSISATAAPIVITFDENPPIDIGAGQIVDNEYNTPDFGNLVVSANANLQSADFAVIFDSNNFTGNDPDLDTPGTLGNAAAENLGNLLIIQENTGGLAAVGNQVNLPPNDYQGGGTITFVWGIPVFDFHFHFVDMETEEDDTSLVHFYTNPGDLVPYASLAFSDFLGVSGIAYGDNSVNYFSIPDVNTLLGAGGPYFSRKIVFELSSSGAVGSIGYSPVPEPGTLLLLGTGLLGLAGWARRRSAAQRLNRVSKA